VRAGHEAGEVQQGAGQPVKLGDGERVSLPAADEVEGFGEGRAAGQALAGRADVGQVRDDLPAAPCCVAA
jgi:hypothetical protein